MRSVGLRVGVGRPGPALVRKGAPDSSASDDIDSDTGDHSASIIICRRLLHSETVYLPMIAPAGSGRRDHRQVYCLQAPTHCVHCARNWCIVDATNTLWTQVVNYGRLGAGHADCRACGMRIGTFRWARGSLRQEAPDRSPPRTPLYDILSYDTASSFHIATWRSTVHILVTRHTPSISCLIAGRVLLQPFRVLQLGQLRTKPIPNRIQ